MVHGVGWNTIQHCLAYIFKRRWDNEHFNFPDGLAIAGVGLEYILALTHSHWCRQWLVLGTVSHHEVLGWNIISKCVLDSLDYK